MHFHLEIILPPCKDSEIPKKVAHIMEPFDENQEPEDGYRSPHVFWDFYVIGGRWEGEKILRRVGETKLAAFEEELMKRGITVHGFHCGKPELNPPDQIPMVDALWREMCPGGGDQCYLFRHATAPYEHGFGPGEICKVADMPAELTAERVIVGGGWEERAATMYETNYWNGVTHVDTTFSGKVTDAIKAHNKRHENGQVGDDWIVVTVDCHS